MIVIRLNSENNLCISRPCFKCLQTLKTYNIKKVYYSDDNSNIIKENVTNMISIHITKLYSTHIYIEKTITKFLPGIINIYNLNTFIKYNLSKLRFSYELVKLNNKHFFVLLDENKKIIKRLEIYL